MLLTTMVPVLLMLATVYFMVICKVPSKLKGLSYIAILVPAVLYFMIGGVHFAYMGIESLTLGVFLVWLHYRFWYRLAIIDPEVTKR